MNILFFDRKTERSKGFTIWLPEKKTEILEKTNKQKKLCKSAKEKKRTLNRTHVTRWTLLTEMNGKQNEKKNIARQLTTWTTTAAQKLLIELHRTQKLKNICNK